jgi:hypothetical protein
MKENMAGQSRIIARITALTGSTGLPDTHAEFLVTYRCTGPVAGLVAGELTLQVDVTQNQSQIEGDLQTQLAAYVNNVVTPAQGYQANDVRGLGL